ncbi:MAG TPA: AraC family transcriptional regulator [Longimicrobium sp.]|jgi:AraC-like DNA-binding protein|uniref:AraC family transcriptional regulator n=1 Tax=Longimicrobium sp. TaxID=2029185 RepID=UPI002ED96A90
MSADAAANRPAAIQPTSAYHEFAPPDAAREHLVCLWTQQVGGGDVDLEQNVLPDACVDVIWVNGEPTVAGPATRASVALLPPGTLLVGARFRPGWCAGVLGVDASELQDQHLPLADVSPALARRFSTAVADVEPVADRLAAAGALLARQLAGSPPPDGIIRATVRWLAAHPHGRVHELGRALHLSDRQLQRRMLSAVGYAPKTLHRILRFQRLLALATAGGPHAVLSSLALRAGYADQAHMTRELRQLAGRSPTELLPGAESALQKAELF